jgi:tetratricopeptide (TPR) repeat protein
MVKSLLSTCLCVLLLLAVGVGCKRSRPASAHRSSDYFQTDFQDESQFIVETIASDLAEQVYFAKFHRLPEDGKFFISVTETPDSPLATPVYDLRIDLDARHVGLTNRLNIEGPIWSPEVYGNLTASLARTVGLDPGANEGSKDTALLARLTGGLAQTIEEENQTLSRGLEADFANPSLHEAAAVLLGAFALREHSGDFYEIRSPLCRMTSHLAIARYLSGSRPLGVNGRVAGVMLQTLMNNEAAALAELSGIPTNDAALASWARALQARITGDYRPLDKLDGLSRIECIEWFDALDRSANCDIAWGKLSDEQKQTADFVRIANSRKYSVGMGHELLAVSLRLEYREIASVYQIAHGGKLAKDGLVPALNEMPERCFSTGPNQKTRVAVIGWGLWAGFFQRQLCMAVQENFDLLQRMWGVPDDARSYSTNCDRTLNGLRLYPFVRRFNCTDVTSYHQSVDDGFKVTVATPQLVPAECWNYLCYNLSSVESYHPNPNPHVDEWHKHNPPPGTVYNLHPRLDHSNLVRRPETSALLDQLLERAPYDQELAYYVYATRYKKQPTYPQAEALFSKLLPFWGHAMMATADTLQDQPEKYEALMSRAAEINPVAYFHLADYFEKLNQDDKVAAYIEKGNARDPDSVTASYHASWLIKYYLKKGNVEAARKEADFAGDVYSDVGLQAKAEFLEATGDYPGAFEWYSHVAERYSDSGPVMAFCRRYKAKTGDGRFEAEMMKNVGQFPNGLEMVKLGDFKSPPADGVVFKGDSDRMRAVGLSAGDVIVAVYGIRVRNQAQYDYGRETSSSPELDLIVWIQPDRRYREIKTDLPGHRFGVDIGDYHPK